MRRALVVAVGALALVPAGAGAHGSPRIIDGTQASIAQWPFIAALVSRGADAYDGQFCGGSLIAPTLVLTAAHCVDGKPFDVVLGRDQLSGTGGERIPVTGSALPPGYDASRNLPDIAVLQLARPAVEVPIALASAADDAALTKTGSPLAVAGWGLTEQDPDESPDDLHATTVTALSNSTCSRAYGADFRASVAICAEGADDRDSCSGDSGGPLVGGGPGALRLVGAVSFGGKTCGDPDAPGVYARIGSQAAWLSGLLAAQGIATPPPVTPAPVTADPRDVRIAFGRIGCGTSRCQIDLKVTGPRSAVTGGFVVEVRRSGSVPVDRFALARKIAPGRYRAFVDLPFGTLHLSAFGVDPDATTITKTTRLTVRVVHDD